MRTVDTQEEFVTLLKAEQAIIFIYFAWSAPAHRSQRLVQEWERQWTSFHPDLDVMLYELDPDQAESAPAYFSSVNNWLAAIKETGGYGSLVWIRQGQIAGYERDAAQVGIRALADKTERIFRQAAPSADAAER